MTQQLYPLGLGENSSRPRPHPLPVPQALGTGPPSVSPPAFSILNPCLSLTPPSSLHAKPGSGVLPSWGHLRPQIPRACRSLEKVEGGIRGQAAGVPAQGMLELGFPDPYPFPAFHRHDWCTLRGWPPRLWPPAGHWPRDPPAQIPWPCHSRRCGEYSSQGPALLPGASNRFKSTSATHPLWDICWAGGPQFPCL